MYALIDGKTIFSKIDSINTPDALRNLVKKHISLDYGNVAGWEVKCHCKSLVSSCFLRKKNSPYYRLRSRGCFRFVGVGRFFYTLYKIKHAIRCKISGDEIESTYRHDYVTCSCGACAVDGGHNYLRRGNVYSWDLVMVCTNFSGEMPQCFLKALLKW